MRGQTCDLRKIIIKFLTLSSSKTHPLQQAVTKVRAVSINCIEPLNYDSHRTYITHSFTFKQLVYTVYDELPESSVFRCFHPSFTRNVTSHVHTNMKFDWNKIYKNWFVEDWIFSFNSFIIFIFVNCFFIPKSPSFSVLQRSFMFPWF